MRAGVLISGRGGNMLALARAAALPGAPFEIGLVLSNRPQAEGLARAQGLRLKTAAVDHRDFSSREAFDAALDAELRAHDIDFIYLAGFMRILTPAFIARWEGRLLNIHPSLLPAFRGLKAVEQALDAGVRITGCTVHFVSAELDAGPILGQAAVSVAPDDTPERLGARIAEAEHTLYPACAAALARGDVKLAEGRAVWRTDAEYASFCKDA